MTTTTTTTTTTATTTPLQDGFRAGLYVLARYWGYTVPRVLSDGTIQPAESEWRDVVWLRVGTNGTGNQGHFVPVFGHGHGRGAQFVKAYRTMKASKVADFCSVGHQAAVAILRVDYAHSPGVIDKAVEVAEVWGGLARHLQGWKVPECPESHRGMAEIGITGKLSHPRKVAVWKIAEVLVGSQLDGDGRAA